MTVNVYERTVFLLTKIANSIHDRAAPNEQKFYFSRKDFAVAEVFVQEMVAEIEEEIKSSLKNLSPKTVDKAVSN